jgi:predicted signal transduction protein with EAL and GGDEF domain
VSRKGGVVFVVLIWEVKQAQDAAITAEKIITALREAHQIDGHELHITGSIGIVTYPDDGTDAETLMKKADLAMYHAKDVGRDNFQFFKSAMNIRAMERQSLEGSLRHAIERRELSLHYQSKIDLETGAIVGVEALIRWRHPERGPVSPGEFIAIAEACGLIVPIGRWVLREACRQGRAWQLAGLPAMGIAVNISAVELRAAGFVDGVRTILRETCLDPRCLELELTESVLMADSRSVAVVLKELKDIGVLLALDDFGTGYSSLSYLKRFPIDALKIDQSFVRDLTTDEDDAGIVTAVIGLGRSLHMRVVAEGVETREQLAILQEYGCPQGQGYYFSRPLPAVEFCQLLESSETATALA